VNVPLVNSAWVSLLEELMGPSGLDPLTLARSFHYRAYFNMAAFGRVFKSLGMPAGNLERIMGIDISGGKQPVPFSMRMLGSSLAGFISCTINGVTETGSKDYNLSLDSDLRVTGGLFRYPGENFGQARYRLAPSSSTQIRGRIADGLPSGAGGTA
jgi:hypothetical protein